MARRSQSSDASTGVLMLIALVIGIPSYISAKMFGNWWVIWIVAIVVVIAALVWWAIDDYRKTSQAKQRARVAQAIATINTRNGRLELQSDAEGQAIIDALYAARADVLAERRAVGSPYHAWSDAQENLKRLAPSAIRTDLDKWIERKHYLSIAEPIPTIEPFLPKDFPEGKSAVDVLNTAMKRLDKAFVERDQREKQRLDLFAKSDEIQNQLRIVVAAEAAEEERQRVLWQQSALWPKGTVLAAEAADVVGIENQVVEQNAWIESQIEALTELLPKGLTHSLPAVTTVIPQVRQAERLAEHVASVLTTMPLPHGFDLNAKSAYSAESRQLVVECELPKVDVVPPMKHFRYVKSRYAVVGTARPAAQIKGLYSGAIAQLALLSLARIFQSDSQQLIDVVVFNGVIDTIDPRTGRPTRPCLITVRTTRDTFAEINLDGVDPASCLKFLNAAVSKNPTELSPVRPLLEFSMIDPRFIAETDTIGALDSRPNLMELTPNEFESLISNLFEKIGLDTRQTRASRDGGVDCVAYNTDPILGGKVVIQAKRYKHTVGVSAVRDLYGTLQNEGASKGILVTTSGYGKASFEFADGKPIELFDGAHLLYLLEKHAGITARIEAPDDWQDPVADSAELSG